MIAQHLDMTATGFYINPYGYIYTINPITMNFFKAKTTWTNAEFIVLKLCIASIYLLAGSYFHDDVQRYTLPLLLLFAATCIWAVYLWVVKMKQQKAA